MENPTSDLIEQPSSTPAQHEPPHEHHFNQKRSQRLVVTIFLLFVIAVVAASAYYFGSQSRKMVPPTYVPPTYVPPTQTISPTLSPITTSTGNLKTYIGIDFSFQYPEYFTKYKIREPYFLPNRLVDISSERSDLIAPNYLQENILVVSFSNDSQKCLESPQENAQSLGKKQLGDNEFSVYTINDAGAGNRYDSTIYRIIKNQNCFEFTYTIHTSSDWIGIDVGESDKSIVNAKNIFIQVLSTLNFKDLTQLTISPNSWQTIVFIRDGFSIDIPATWMPDTTETIHRLAPKDFIQRLMLPKPLTTEEMKDLEANSIYGTILNPSESLPNATEYPLKSEKMLKNDKKVVFYSSAAGLKTTFNKIVSSFKLIE